MNYMLNGPIIDSTKNQSGFDTITTNLINNEILGLKTIESDSNSTSSLNTHFIKVLWEMTDLLRRTETFDLYKESHFDILQEAKSSTRVELPSLSTIEDKILNTLQPFSDIEHEDGKITPLDTIVPEMIRHSDDKVIFTLLCRFIQQGKISTNLAYEILLILGGMKDQQTHENRRWLLQNCLEDSSYYIRDAACVGLSYLDDPMSIDSLKNAIEKEPIPEIKSDLESTLCQLQETMRAQVMGG